MTGAAENIAEATDLPRRSVVVDDALKSLRIAGSVLLREAYEPPWAIAIPTAEELAVLLGVAGAGNGAGSRSVRPARVVAFHLVEFGHCVVRLDAGDGKPDERLLKAGEILISFGGNAHQLSRGSDVVPQPIEALLAGGANIQRPVSAAGSEQTALLCGVFLLHPTGFNPLFSALPPILHSSLSRQGELHNLSGVARLMAEEIDRHALGGGYVVERLLEVLCAEAIRAHIEAVSEQQASWFRGIRDPLVGRAIATIHERPAEPWSVRRLAEAVAMSPSRFAARFVEAVGDSPMAYVGKWRMELACRELDGSSNALDQVAASVGYESTAAFSRAFKKLIGVSPAAWRAGRRQ